MKKQIKIHIPYLIKEIFEKVVRMDSFGNYFYETTLIFYWNELDCFAKKLDFTTAEETDSINGEIIGQVSISTDGDSAWDHIAAKEWLRKDIEDELYEMLINQGYEPIFINHVQVFGYNADECKCTYSAIISDETEVNDFLHYYDESYKYIANFDNIYILTEKEAKRYKGSIIQG